jgi:hypothetical protein
VVSGGGTVVGCDGEETKGWGRTIRRKRNERVRGKNDLKRGHVRAQIACDRTYVHAFDHIRAESVCVKWALCWNVQGTFKRMSAEVGV